jgi:hypothetical protein
MHAEMDEAYFIMAGRGGIKVLIKIMSNTSNMNPRN